LQLPKCGGWRRDGVHQAPVTEVGVEPQGVNVGLLVGGQHQEVEAVPTPKLQKSPPPRRPDPGDLARVGRSARSSRVVEESLSRVVDKGPLDAAIS
jgi:hypothetical protein